VSKIGNERGGFANCGDGFAHGFGDCLNCSAGVNHQRLIRGLGRRLRRRHW
jgi:hypothetical protein